MSLSALKCVLAALKASDFYFFREKRPRARICLPSVYLMKYLCSSRGTLANICALCSEEKGENAPNED